MLKKKKIPMRMCVVTHERFEKKDLIRIVKTDNGIVVDLTGKLNGRGYYLKKDKDVINKAQKNKILDNLFGEQVNDKVYNDALEACRD
jgi:predicted RNA-binding protein YlxR (DUF448 family)